MYEIMPMTRKPHITRTYNPFALFDELEKSFLAQPQALGFRTDVKDLGDSIELTAELPGFGKDQIDIEVEDEVLTISAERKNEVDEKDDEGNYLRRERTYGSYQRTFNVANIDVDKIAVTYTDGILKLDMPKKEEPKPEVRKLEIC
ncbi:MAG: Hsp20/alpha crystallin family protein [Coriobacteriales bacterium]|jgi:HSP20 family protein